MVIFANWRSCLTALFIVLVLAWIGLTWVFTAVGGVLLFLIKAVAWVAAGLVLLVLFARVGDSSAPTGQRVGALLAAIVGLIICICVWTSGADLTHGPRVDLTAAQVTVNPTLVGATELTQNLDSLQGKPVKIGVTAVKVTEDGGYIDALCSVTDSKSPVLVSYKSSTDTPKIAEGDQAVVWGLLQGKREYQAKGEDKQTLPAIAVGVVRPVGEPEKITVTDAKGHVGTWDWSVTKVMRRNITKSGCVNLSLEMTASSTPDQVTALGTRCLPTITAIDGTPCEITPDSMSSSVQPISSLTGQSDTALCQPFYDDVPYPLKTITLKFFGTSRESIYHLVPDTSQNTEVTVNLP